MLIKEYRVPLPLSVDEYRIAQLYMIQKKSREESKGAGSGVEILINEPYTDGPGGNGQYTYKIYHIGSHLPGWFRAILPKSALKVEEEAWNAYPYTKTRYRCPFVEKFLLEIETRYLADAGQTDNVFNLTSSELRSRSVDIMDVVKDPVSSGDYKKDEDPRCFKSGKTKRGPLNDNWRQEYMLESLKVGSTKNVMCAYKLCKVEFRYWGMQGRIEGFIHDIGLRKTMLRAHRQAWCWQDEWFGLELDDIRKLERETQMALARTMGDAYEDDGEGDETFAEGTTTKTSSLQDENTSTQQNSKDKAEPAKDNGAEPRPSIGSLSGNRRLSGFGMNRKSSWSSSKGGSRMSGTSQSAGWQAKSIEKLHDSMSESDDEFYDAQEMIQEDDHPLLPKMLYKSNSNEMLSSGDDLDDEDRCHSLPIIDGDSRLASRIEEFQRMSQVTHSMIEPVIKSASNHASRTDVLIMALHGGSILESNCDLQSQQGDISTLRMTFEHVLRAHYPHMQGRVAIRLIKCPYVCCETLGILSSLSPFGFDIQKKQDPITPPITRDFLPLGSIALFATASSEYYEQVSLVISRANYVYQEFLLSEEGRGFSGQVCMVGDAVGGIIGYDSLCRSNNSISENSSYQGSQDLRTDDVTAMTGNTSPSKTKSCSPTTVENTTKSSKHSPDAYSQEPDCARQKKRSCEVVFDTCDTVIETDHVPACSSLGEGGDKRSPIRKISSSSHTTNGTTESGIGLKLDFEVNDFFTFGSPLGLVLAFRRVNFEEDKNVPPSKPPCTQMYNLFHLTDPSASRLEPLIDERFKTVAPHTVPRHQKFPLGDGQSTHIVECFHKHRKSLASYRSQCGYSGVPIYERRESAISTISTTFNDDIHNHIAYVINRWWGSKRLDYALYCPEVLNSFPLNSLPHLFHASYWESRDVAAFILRQVIQQSGLDHTDGDVNTPASPFTPSHPREKWLHKRTSIKCRNISPNHRGNDVILLEDRPQVLSAKFMYGPLDMVSLNREKVDIHIMTAPPSGEWLYLSTEMTDGNGRLLYSIPAEKHLSQGMYPVKMVVRGDHTCADFYLTVLPPKTECAVFSIDGSFTASMSIMGKDPKVRPGAVDVVRHWQELGYLIIYISARPDMQANRVTTWLAQHNFPHGMVSFMELTKDPLKQKAHYLKGLVNENQLAIKAAYGSNKDVYVYENTGISYSNMYIVGKLSRSSKHYSSQINHISNGYASHLSYLTERHAHPAVGNARLFIRKSCFGLPGQTHKPVKHSQKIMLKRESFLAAETSNGQECGIAISLSGNTVVDAGQLGAGKAVQARGSSPRVKLSK